MKAQATFDVARFLEADFSGSIRVSPEGNLEFANHLLGTSVRLQVEHKQLIEMRTSSAHRLGETANFFALICNWTGDRIF